jgi:hypothetical protein
MTFKIPALQLERARQATRLLKAIEMNAIDIYRRAIKRTFADLYGVAPDEVDVSWSKDGDNITVRCANKTFTHETIHDDDDSTLEFVSNHEDPVTVRLNDEECRRLERTDLDRLNGF